MAFLKSASRRGTFESGFSAPLARRSRAFWLPLIGEQVYDEEAAIDSHQAWSEGAERYQDRDGDLVKAWADQADGLVTFAALFSAVVTSFIIDSYTALQPDPRIITIDILLQIAAQLNGTTSSAADGLVFGSDAPFEPAFTDVLRNSTLFASLICSLLAAGMGIFYKEWLREYTRGLPDDPRELMRTRHFRYLGMQRWRMQEILSGISIFLQLGVAFFILAVVLFAWPLHPIVRLVLNVFVIIWVLFWIGTAFCPLVSADCPFKSPLSRAIFGAVSLIKYVMRKGRSWVVGRASNAEISLPHTLEAQEKGEVVRCGDDLDKGALTHLYNSHWGDAWLATLDPCVKELDADVATELIREIVALRFGATPVEDVMNDPVLARDPGVMRLAGLWKLIAEKHRARSPTNSPSAPGPEHLEESRTPTQQPSSYGNDFVPVPEQVDQATTPTDDGYETSFSKEDMQYTTSADSDLNTLGISMSTLPKDNGVLVCTREIAAGQEEYAC